MPSLEHQQKLGEILLVRSKADNVNLDRALKVQEVSRADSANAEKIGAILTRLGMVSSRDLAEALALQRGWTIVQASEFPEIPVLEESISVRFIRESRAIPLAESEEEIELIVVCPLLRVSALPVLAEALGVSLEELMGAPATKAQKRGPAPKSFRPGFSICLHSLQRASRRGQHCALGGQ